MIGFLGDMLVYVEPCLHVIVECQWITIITAKYITSVIYFTIVSGGVSSNYADAIHCFIAFNASL